MELRSIPKILLRKPRTQPRVSKILRELLLWIHLRNPEAAQTESLHTERSVRPRIYVGEMIAHFKQIPPTLLSRLSRRTNTKEHNGPAS